MADQDQAVDTDYSGRPYRLPTTEEVLEAPLLDNPYDILVAFSDGRTALYTGDGRYHLAKDDGWPDWDQPVHIPGLSPEPPRDGDLIIRSPEG